MILLNDKFLVLGSEPFANKMSVSGVNYVVLLTVDKNCRDFAFTDICEDYVERVELEFVAVLLGHFQSEGNHELGCFNVFAGYLKGYHFEGVEGTVDYLQDDVFGVVLEGVKEGRGCSH